jgi:fructose 1,6-bisphosphate aldolase/phosphatase
MNTSGLLLSPSMTPGFKFVIRDVNYTEGDRVIELNASEDLYSIAEWKNPTSNETSNRRQLRYARVRPAIFCTNRGH